MDNTQNTQVVKPKSTRAWVSEAANRAERRVLERDSNAIPSTKFQVDSLCAAIMDPKVSRKTLMALAASLKSGGIAI
jgi:hypothetical protein